MYQTLAYTKQISIFVVLFVINLDIVLSDEKDNYREPCDPLKESCQARLNTGPKTTPEPEREENGDPDKYGLVPAFLIGASGVILIYIISHCLYLHCYAKKKMRDIAAGRCNDNVHSTSQQTATSNLLNDGPSQASLAVRYDGSYGQAEIINSMPYIVCQDGSTPTQNHDHSNIQKPLLLNNKEESKKNKGTFFSRFKSNQESEEPSSQKQALCLNDDYNCERERGSFSSEGKVCYVPQGVNPMIGGGGEGEMTTEQRRDWTPVQAYMYNPQYKNGSGEPNDQTQGHRLVFFPIPPTQADTQIQNYNTYAPNDFIGDPLMYKGGGGSAEILEDEEDVIEEEEEEEGIPGVEIVGNIQWHSTQTTVGGNASNMVVPMIIENPASMQGSRENLAIHERKAIEHKAIVHGATEKKVLKEHAV